MVVSYLGRLILGRSSRGEIDIELCLTLAKWDGIFTSWTAHPSLQVMLAACRQIERGTAIQKPVSRIFLSRTRGVYRMEKRKVTLSVFLLYASSRNQWADTRSAADRGSAGFQQFDGAYLTTTEETLLLRPGCVETGIVLLEGLIRSFKCD